MILKRMRKIYLVSALIISIFVNIGIGLADGTHDQSSEDQMNMNGMMGFDTITLYFLAIFLLILGIVLWLLIKQKNQRTTPVLDGKRKRNFNNGNNNVLNPNEIKFEKLTTLFCQNCGNRVETDSKFCDNCGVKI
ncbi:MAG: zinc ribbon domain-containing protein [Candidatus Hodarchaeales archaeon]|jgi:preprotein translocase subunit SecG